jgi:(p)ppGpp synthase/HD superfamily hydrolase
MKKGEMLSKMIVIATLGHADQFDKGGNPYILHPLRVMSYLKEADEELQCIAVGHDVIEDCSGKVIYIDGVERIISYQMLRVMGMTERVIEGIRGLTKIPGQTYEEYQAIVFGNIDCMKVKKCDLRHNTDIRRLKGVSDKDTARMAKYMKFYADIEMRLNIKVTV